MTNVTNCGIIRISYKVDEVSRVAKAKEPTFYY
nr:MAG TPA: hypothetical protein [Caudoviricetes sp.]